MVLSRHLVLFVSYNGMLDPLGQTQVIPYLKELAARGIEFKLLSFERTSVLEAVGLAGREQLKRDLASFNIDWHWLRYHKRLSLLATSYDVFAGVRYATRLAKQHPLELVHARSHIPATIGLILKKRFTIKMIFDVRGLMAEEYVDAGHWREQSIKFKLTKAVERKALAAADGVVTLTKRIWPIIKEWDGLRNREVVHAVVPCCADLNLFSYSVAERAKRRNELGLGAKLTIIYSGSIDGWYLTERMADFFAFVLRRRPESHFVWLTSGRERVEGLMQDRGVPASNFTVRFVSSQEVPSYLSAADVGLAFIMPAFSKLASSPTKFAEYLGCGLPIVTNPGIGDSDDLMTTGVGALVKEFNTAEYATALSVIERLLETPETIRKRARATAERLFDVRVLGVKRYRELYERVLNP
jgi:glycosyltransferase involved in cell wall biosynthesis